MDETYASNTDGRVCEGHELKILVFIRFHIALPTYKPMPFACLQQEVRDTNTLARQRVEANRLEDLVKAGKRDIEAGQRRVDSLLNRILGRQDQSIQVGGWKAGSVPSSGWNKRR